MTQVAENQTATLAEQAGWAALELREQVRKLEEAQARLEADFADLAVTANTRLDTEPRVGQDFKEVAALSRETAQYQDELWCVVQELKQEVEALRQGRER